MAQTDYNKIDQKLEQITTKNRLITGASTLLGSGLGALIGNTTEHPGIGAVVGGIAGGYLSDAFTKDPEEELNKIIYGPYHEIVQEFLDDCADCIDIIGKEWNFRYQIQFNKAEKSYLKNRNGKLKDKEFIKKERQDFLDFAKLILGIIDEYIKESKQEVNPDIKEYYIHTLQPQYQLFKKYYKDTKVIIENIQNLIHESLLNPHVWQGVKDGLNPMNIFRHTNHEKILNNTYKAAEHVVDKSTRQTFKNFKAQHNMTEAPPKFKVKAQSATDANVDANRQAMKDTEDNMKKYYSGQLATSIASTSAVVAPVEIAALNTASDVHDGMSVRDSITGRARQTAYKIESTAKHARALVRDKVGL